ncbi:Rad4-domain-containing protein [Lactarius indigo]|nr:Rad4-domain-containing protein [Lactarius indigo]
MSTQGAEELAHNFSSDSEDEFDWEEVAVPQAGHFVPEDQAGPSTKPNIEITLDAYPGQGKDGTQKKLPGGISQAERLLRIDCHKVHTVALISNARERNRWINDELLQARLLSLTPLAIHNSFAMIHKSRIPDDVKRGYLFELAMSRLATWWADTFFTVKPTGHLCSRTFEDVQQVLLSMGLIDGSDKKGKGKALPPDIDLLEDDSEVEIVRSAKSLMKHALMRSGSRDVSSQLFTALCRALGIPSRLVVSLQSVPWQTNVGRPKAPTKPKGANPKGKGVERGNAGRNNNEYAQEGRDEYSSGDHMQVDGDSEDETSPVNGKGNGRKAHTIKLRKTKSVGRKLRSPYQSEPSDPLTTPPVFWTEVFSRADGRWLPVDPIRAIVNKRKVFDPTPVGTAPRRSKVDNRMTYVLAVEEDGYMRDVTPRYAKQYSAKVTKVQSGGRGRREWWEQVMQTVTRPYKLHRDDIEDDELVVNQFTEGMPTTLGGFKDHPFYVLERHLLRDQIISQDAPELGTFRGESVYSRSQVLHLKAAENWMRSGRVVRAGEQPLKYVKQRAVTLSRRRELEFRAGAEGANGSSDVMQGLYAERQTERYVPPPVIDGRIPKNNFGNIDLYTPSMLPAGAAYIPHKGAAKIARQLGFDYAEAVTSFEFRKGKAFPVISGVVVSAENEDTVREVRTAGVPSLLRLANRVVQAYWEAEHAATQKEQEKRHQAVLKRWTKLVRGLRIRQRMREQYGTPTTTTDPPPSGNDDEGGDQDEGGGGGGFLTSVGDVVQPYSLPRPTHVVFSSPPRSPEPNGRTPTPASEPAFAMSLDEAEAECNDAGEGPGLDERSDRDRPAEGLLPSPSRGMPKSMAELAAEAEAAATAQGQEQGDASEQGEEGATSAATPRRRRAPPRARPKANGEARTGKKRARAREREDEDEDEWMGDARPDGVDSGIEEADERPRGAKRARTRAAGRGRGAAPAVPVSSDRVLRVRKSK